MPWGFESIEFRNSGDTDTFDGFTHNRINTEEGRGALTLPRSPNKKISGRKFQFFRFPNFSAAAGESSSEITQRENMEAKSFDADDRLTVTLIPKTPNFFSFIYFFPREAPQQSGTNEI